MGRCDERTGPTLPQKHRKKDFRGLFNPKVSLFHRIQLYSLHGLIDSAISATCALVAFVAAFTSMRASIPLIKISRVYAIPLLVDRFWYPDFLGL